MSDTHFISVDCRGELSANALCFSILESWPAGPLSSARIRPCSRDSAVNSQEFTRIAVSTYLCFTPETGRENREFYEGRGKTPHWLFALRPLCSDNAFCTSPLTFNFHFPKWKMEFVKSSLTSALNSPLNFSLLYFQDGWINSVQRGFAIENHWISIVLYHGSDELDRGFFFFFLYI